MNPIEETTGLQVVTNFSQGFISGLGQDLGVDQFVTCTTESYQTALDLYASIQHLFGTTYFDKLISLEKFGSSLMHISRGIFECQLAYNADFSEVMHIKEKIFNHPNLFLKGLLTEILLDGNIMLKMG
jgi:hypothetical protein